ncbi:hypothetical protein PROFUN_00554 [Planoprotostelium fungivorum]|uniref:DUF1446 domain-containing protein n=1 Tax=Planoprotostelium fungivorum TaxID=1890364 RepID=A0A2P6N171_9EUKA|nr:hypothetical protein PROFUN_00554 [Planoprotostelium fungivorum]
MQKSVRIGCHSAFWGDSVEAARQLVEHGGHLDYLVSDYLAEITMCILARSKKKARGGAGDGGFVQEFVDYVWRPLMKPLLDRNIKVITNAGGMNPKALKEAIEKATADAGLPVPKIAAVVERLADLRGENALKTFQVGGEEEKLWDESKLVMSANAYIGAFPIAQALEDGAQVVVTGRCVDSAIVLGPLIHEYGWKEEQYDLLSSGSLAGHIIECGCQATGGNFTDWRESLKGGWDNVGFPIVECAADGSFIVTKPEKTGGIVTVATVCEQLLYEIGDPAAYILPDVTCDWSNVIVEQQVPSSGGAGRVSVRGAKGRSPTDTYKVSITSVDGFRMNATLMIGGESAAEKAEAVGRAILNRASNILKRRKMPPFTHTSVEALGSEHTYGPHSAARQSREVSCRWYKSRDHCSASPVILFSSCLVPREKVEITIYNGDSKRNFEEKKRQQTSGCNCCGPQCTCQACKNKKLPSPTYVTLKGDQMVQVPLLRLCYARSGDKGDLCNVGVIARSPNIYPFLLSFLTQERVTSHFQHLVQGKITRYPLPGISALNFVMTRALGGDDRT